MVMSNMQLKNRSMDDLFLFFDSKDLRLPSTGRSKKKQKKKLILMQSNETGSQNPESTYEPCDLFVFVIKHNNYNKKQLKTKMNKTLQYSELEIHWLCT